MFVSHVALKPIVSGYGGAPRRRLEVRSQAGKDRQPWDVGRFLQTVLFFNPPPKPEQVLKSIVEAPMKALGAVVEARNPPAVSPVTSSLIPLEGGHSRSPATNVVLVTGATGGVGRRVVCILLERGYNVRALVRDVDKAREMFSTFIGKSAGKRLELAPADLAQQATLLPEFAENVSRVIWCSAANVVPKEGDSPDRAKYYQGIKFYDPKVEGDTPEAVEYKGMVNVLTLLKNRLPRESGLPIFSTVNGNQALPEWGPVDDVVMGGVSASGFSMRDAAGEGATGPAGVFSGNVTTANNGGFASVRTRNFTPPLDVSTYDGIELRVRGDGQRYKLILRTEGGWDGIGYTASFDTGAGEWQSVKIPFSRFVPVFRARTMSAAPALDTKQLYSVQLMLSKFEYDGKLNPSFREGLFELPVSRIAAYTGDPATPRFVMVSSAGVTRPGRPGIDVEQEPPAVKLNDALGGLLTYKLKAEDALRASEVPFAIVRPVALTEEPAGAELVLDQGDTVRGKVSRDDVAELCVELLGQPIATGTTFEIKSTVPFSTPWTGKAEGSAPRDWKELLGSARLERGVTGKTVNGEYRGRSENPG